MRESIVGSKLSYRFNAAYAGEVAQSNFMGERSVFDDYFGRLLALDTGGILYEAIWKRFSGSIRLLIDNKYVYHPFWNFQNQVPGNEDWEERFQKAKRRLYSAFQAQDTRTILLTVFDRLYVLRNQIVHGGSTWNSSVNRAQVQDGHRILGFLVPLFIDLMMDNAEVDWGAPYYPVVA